MCSKEKTLNALYTLLNGGWASTIIHLHNVRRRRGDWP